MAMSAESPPESITTAIKDRLTHPVVGIFVIAWVLCNWKVMFFLAADKVAAGERITKAIQYCDSSTLFWTPLAGTAIYILTVPVLKAFAATYTDAIESREADIAHRNKLRRLRRDIDATIDDLNAQEEKVRRQQQAAHMAELVSDQKAKELKDLELAWKELLDITHPKWKLSLPDEGPESKTQTLYYLGLQFRRIDSLKVALKREHPELDC